MPPNQSMLSTSQTTQKVLMDRVAVAGTASVYSSPQVIEDGENFSVFVKVEGTIPHVKIIRCYNPTVWMANGVPEVDKWSESDFDGVEDVLVADFSAKDSWKVKQEFPKPSIWMRYKVTGLDNNGVDTKISINFVKQNKNPAS